MTAPPGSTPHGVAGSTLPGATNQPAPIDDHDAYAADPSLRWWLDQQLRACGCDGLAPHHDAMLHRVGSQVGSQRLRAAADRANRDSPQLETWDRHGRRVDDVVFDPAWDACLDAAVSSGVCGLPWLHPRDGYLVRAAAAELWGRLDMGVMCPVTMTSAAMPVLARDAGGPGAALHQLVLEAAAAGADAVAARTLGGRGGRHPLVGMAMTELEGGSDLSRSTTRAVPQPDGTWLLDGHKWFFSHPVVDAALVLAREEGAGEGSRGLSCFLVPGWLDDGSRNGIELQRLKDKLGTRSLASGEVVFRDAVATRIGEAGRGVATIIEMVVHTRMDCALGSAGILARAVGEAVNHARGRSAFGGRLVDKPLMRMVLADLLLEREASLALAMEIARCFQAADPRSRLITPIGKYWITRRAVLGCIECVEALGGNGYTEEYPVARLYRDAQVNSTWEGSGNVMALDVLRALAREPELASALRARVAELLEGAPDDVAHRVATTAADTAIPADESDARRFTGRTAVVLQAALLAHRAAVTGADDDAAISRAFVSTRLDSPTERVFGDGDRQLQLAAEPLLARAPLPGA